ncbi:MAG TPA: glycoside hydrolase family 27 protein [Bryobacteraceae bacterium]|nr:glycoside hydrolase family 27 protein [Bryobacteraceae bacterium]
MKTTLAALLLAAATLPAADLTGNWVVAQPQSDGTSRNTYLNLKQEGEKIAGTIRVSQFFYSVKESSGGPETFTLNASLMDGHSERRTTYTVRLAGDELHVSAAGRGGALGPDMVAHRAPAGEGAYPARVAPPSLHKVPYNGLAKTPPMGWNSWNKFHGRVDDASVRSIADAMASNGMKAAGYLYVNIDDTWEGTRDAAGNIQSNKKFPDMKALADYVHSKGLKLGIYSSPGPNTCAGYEGSYGHEEQDAKTWAAWGIDYLKYDWCSARNLYTDEEMQAVYQKMGDALHATSRPIVYSLCQYGRAEVWKWGPEVSGNLWRTTGDISDRWQSMLGIFDKQNVLTGYAAPGHFNDPDMLEIGNGGMTDTEYRAHMSLWSILAAPLLAGNDLRDMTPSILDILTNREVIAVDQDPLGKQGRRLSQSGDQEIWMRDLTGNAKAVVFFNRGGDSAKMTLKFSDAGIKGEPKIRDLWARQDVAASNGEFSATVPSHGVVMIKLSAGQ